MMDFDRAMNVRVNGKEVNRFAINGITIWEKYTPASILLESDKSYASEGDIITLTATVYDKFGRGCPDKTVEFINDDTSELIATATTNSNGIASVSYLVQGSESLYIKSFSSGYATQSNTEHIQVYMKYIFDDCSSGIPSDKYESVGTVTEYTTYNNYKCMYQRDNSRLVLGTFKEFEFSADFCIPGQWAFTGLLKNGVLYINSTPSSDCGGATICSKYTPHGQNTWFTFKVIAKNNHIDLYINDVLKVSSDVTLETAEWSIREGTNINPRYTKNVELKAIS